MKPVKDMTYKEWLQYKREEEKRKTHGAEAVEDDQLYDIYFAVDRVCFDRHMPFVKLYYIPPDLAKDHSAVGMYGYRCIMIDKGYYLRHGADDAVINLMFHELVHAYCDVKHIQDTDGEKHLQAFADACRDHGGVARYAGETDGYNDTQLTPETMQRVRRRLADKRARA